jgi:tetratricopeptide (TPR) repeat protein
MLHRNRFAAAKSAIQEAIRCNPYEADYYAVLASLHLRDSHWPEALAAADRGLEIEPEHPLCTNLRAQSLVNLGDRRSAAQTMGEALARRPDDPYTHANQGWALLHQGQPYKAMEHFREALRLDPEMEWARAGIVEAMKARNFIYRWMLAYFLWMARLKPGVRWGIVIGAYFANRIISQVADKSPELAPFLYPALYAYFGFALMTWLAYPLFNLLLRLNKFGRYALSADQVRGANVLAVCIVVTLGCLAAAVATGEEAIYLATLLFVLLSLPASAIYVCDEGWPRHAMMAMTGGLALLVILALAMAISDVAWSTGLAPLARLVAGLLFLPMLASQFAAMYLTRVTPEK